MILEQKLKSMESQLKNVSIKIIFLQLGIGLST